MPHTKKTKMQQKEKVHRGSRRKFKAFI